MEKVFVYGTLKYKHSNNYLLRQSTMLGVGLTTQKFALYEDGIPYVSKSSKVSKILGEVWLVNKTTLNNLDLLEGHPNWYKREEVNIEYINMNSKRVMEKVWLYFNKNIPSRAKLNKTGSYENKNSKNKEWVF